MTTALLPRGSRFGELRLTGFIGSGGFSDVYEAFSQDGQRLAVKVLRISGVNAVEQQERLERERLALSSIDSRGVAKLVASDVSCDPPWIASEFISGQPLHDVIQDEGHLNFSDGMSLIRRLSEIIEELHNRGIAHRDLTPNNIIVGSDGPVIIDFGSARVDIEDAGTSSYLLAGTTGFIAPEVLRNEPAGRSSDIYALAKIAEYITGGDVDNFPPMLKAALSDNPSGRPTAREIRDALREFQDPFIRSVQRPISKLKRHFQTKTLFSLALIAALLGSLVGFQLQKDPEPLLSFTSGQQQLFLKGLPELQQHEIGSPYLPSIDLPEGIELRRENPGGIADYLALDPLNSLMTLEFFTLTRENEVFDLDLSVEILDPFLVPENSEEVLGRESDKSNFGPIFSQFEKDKVTLLSGPFVSCTLPTPDRATILQDLGVIVLYSENPCYDFTVHLGLAVSLYDTTLTRISGLFPNELSNTVPAIFGSRFRSIDTIEDAVFLKSLNNPDALKSSGFGSQFIEYLRGTGDNYVGLRQFFLLESGDAAIFADDSNPPGEPVSNFYTVRSWMIPLGETLNDQIVSSGIASSMGAWRPIFADQSFLLPNRLEVDAIVGLDITWDPVNELPTFSLDIFQDVIEPNDRAVNERLATLFQDGAYTTDFPITLNSGIWEEVESYRKSMTTSRIGAFEIPLISRWTSKIVQADSQAIAIHMNPYGASEISFRLEDTPSIVVMDGQVATALSDRLTDEFFELFPYCRTQGTFSSTFGPRRIEAQILSSCTDADIFGRLPSAQDSLTRALPIFRVQIWESNSELDDTELLRIIFVPEFADDINYFEELIQMLSDQLSTASNLAGSLGSAISIASP